ncbi:acetate--CoA ligase family protein [Paraburkholderia agricolaris]|uniref:acetate--CoA ligase family protein n=1 Tax=Paraburkholderia agricolaris TaxID=2152888 RepID=UPI001290D5E9|nr:acetate--CoA ligase [Paraburkholderia agricolaris]
MIADKSIKETRRTNLHRLFKPASVAVVGASDQATKVGGRPLDLLGKYEFVGRVYPVNPKYDELFGYRCYADLQALPEIPDLVVVAVPARHVLQVVKDSARLGVGALVIYTSGFGEMGPQGEIVEGQIREIAADTGLIVCGPNCQGIANFSNGMVVNFSSSVSVAPVLPGNVGIVSQSGLIGGLMVLECLARELGVGYLVSTGNEAGMHFSDVVAYMADDPDIKVIAGYLESIRDIDSFREAATRARLNGKSIVILKVGRSPEAAKAAASHTGSLAGSAELYDAALREMGVFLVDSIEELVDASVTFAQVSTVAAGRRIGILTNSGGLGVFCADDVFRQNLEMAKFSDATVAAIAKRLPEFGAASNPVDVTLQAHTDVDTVASHIEHIVNDPSVDVVVVTFGVQMVNVKALTDHLARIAHESPKPLLVSWVASDPDGTRLLAKGGVPVFADPARAVRAARYLVEFSEFAVADSGSHQRYSGAAARLLAEKIKNATAAGSQILGESELRDVLEAMEVAVPRHEPATDGSLAMQAFDRIDSERVVVKIDSDDVLHKSDVGGVVLNVRSREEACKAADEILTAVRTKVPDAKIRGVIVSEMVADGVEVIVGAKRDPVLGAFVMVGLGGIFVEVLKDVVFCPAPVTPERAERMLRSLRAYPLLQGVRGQAPRDTKSLARVIAAASHMIATHPEIGELDLNPVLVKQDGAVAVDALIHLN